MTTANRLIYRVPLHILNHKQLAVSIYAPKPNNLNT